MPSVLLAKDNQLPGFALPPFALVFSRTVKMSSELCSRKQTEKWLVKTPGEKFKGFFCVTIKPPNRVIFWYFNVEVT